MIHEKIVNQVEKNFHIDPEKRKKLVKSIEELIRTENAENIPWQYFSFYNKWYGENANFKSFEEIIKGKTKISIPSTPILDYYQGSTDYLSNWINQVSKSVQTYGDIIANGYSSLIQNKIHKAFKKRDSEITEQIKSQTISRKTLDDISHQFERDIEDIFSYVESKIFVNNLEKFKCRYKDQELLEIAATEIPEYTITDKLGEGADGIVYKAQHEILELVKIKLFKDPEDKIKEAMEQEGITLEDRIHRRYELIDKNPKLRNFTNIAKLYQLGRCNNPRTDKETLFLVGDYVEAGAAESKVGNQYFVRKDITQQNAIPITLKMLDGLQTLHNAGLILKDIKLRNLLVSLDHETVLIDDLETVSRAEDKYQERLTQGSDRYAAPEVLKDIHKASKLSDLYSAAVCFLYVFTGNATLIKNINTLEEEAYNKELFQIIYDVTEDPTQRDFFAQALNYNPDTRFKSANEMANALSHF